MDQSILMKLVWLGAITAIPVAVLAVRKPEAHRTVETRRVVSVEQPVAIEFAGEVQGPRPAEPAPVPEVPRTVVMGGARIKVKSGPAAEPAQASPAAAAAGPRRPSSVRTAPTTTATDTSTRRTAPPVLP